WDEWITDRLPGYPCLPPAPARRFCWGFDDLPVGTELTSPWSPPGHPEVVLAWTPGAIGTVAALAAPLDGHDRVLCFPGAPIVVTVTLPEGGTGVDVLISDDDRGHGDPSGHGTPPVLTCAGFAEHEPG